MTSLVSSVVRGHHCDVVYELSEFIMVEAIKDYIEMTYYPMSFSFKFLNS